MQLLGKPVNMQVQMLMQAATLITGLHTDVKWTIYDVSCNCNCVSRQK